MNKDIDFTIGLGKYYNIENYLEAAKASIADFIRNQGIFSNSSELVVVVVRVGKSDTPLDKVNEIVDFVGSELGVVTNLHFYETEEDELTDKIQIALIGM